MSDTGKIKIKTCRPKIVVKPKVTKSVVAKLVAKPLAKKAGSGSDSDSDEEDLLAMPLYDLRKGRGVLSLTDVNKDIIAVLNKLIDHTIALKASASGAEKTRHSRRINSFIRGRDAIKDYSKKITTGAQAQKDLEGVGKGIATRIQEFLDTGTLKELNEKVDPAAKIIQELTTVTGIGEVKAVSLMKDHGVTSVEDLLQKYESGEIEIARNQLTHHIAVGLKYYYDLQKRMPWSEAHEISEWIHSIVVGLDSKLVIISCGSYRRKKATCGDLDILVSHPDFTESNDMPDTLPKIVTALKSAGILVGDLTTRGKTKYMGVCRLPKSIGRRIDIRFVPHGSLGAATLYFTGSGKFNKIMRYHANLRGYTLNEYGLYKYINMVVGDLVPAVTEKDIFRILNFKYLEPTEREF